MTNAFIHLLVLFGIFTISRLLFNKPRIKLKKKKKKNLDLSQYYTILRSDKRILYFKQTIKNVDYDSFKILYGGFAKDNNHIYFLGRIINKIDRKSFKIIDNAVCRDNNHLYFDGEIVANADPNSFRKLNSFYWKDKNNVYFEIDGRDGRLHHFNAVSNSFRVFKKNNAYAKDKNNVYYYGDIIQEADAKSFGMIDKFYAKDKKNIYHKGLVITKEEYIKMKKFTKDLSKKLEKELIKHLK